jgi:hypothetical protein
MDESVKNIVSALIADDFSHVMRIWKESPYCEKICTTNKADCGNSTQHLKCAEYLEELLASLALETRDTNYRYFAKQVQRNRASLRPIQTDD